MQSRKEIPNFTSMPRYRKKNKTLTIWIADDVADKVEILKCRPGGVTKFIEDRLREMPVTEQELAALKLLRNSN